MALVIKIQNERRARGQGRVAIVPVRLATFLFKVKRKTSAPVTVLPNLIAKNPYLRRVVRETKHRATVRRQGQQR